MKLVYLRYDNPLVPSAGGVDNHQSEFACICKGVGVLEHSKHGPTITTPEPSRPHCGVGIVVTMCMKLHYGVFVVIVLLPTYVGSIPL